MSERLMTYALASYGLTKGVYKVYVQPELTARRAWTAIGLGVLAYELACPDGELLSEGVDRALERRRGLTTAAIGITALHLANALPERVDPFSRAVKYLKRH